MVRENDQKPLACRFKSRCDPDRQFITDLLDEDWEVMVIKRNPDSGEYKFWTLCCAQAEV